MRFFTKRILSIVFALLLLPAFALAEEPSSEDNEPLYVADYFDGTALDMSMYEGKTVFLNFFTQWCPYCMEEMPDIKQAFDLYDPNSLVMILVHPWDGEDADNTASVVEKFHLEGITTIEDKDFELTSIVGVPGYPTSIVIDPDGYLYYAAASKLDINLLTTLFDDLDIPHRDAVTADATEAVMATPEPVTPEE